MNNPPFHDPEHGQQGSFLRPESETLSEKLLDGLRTSVIFFNTEGVVLRTNASAREDLHANEELTGRRLSELLTLACRNENILPGMLARFEDGLTEEVELPRDTFMRTTDGNAQFFVVGGITRLGDDEFIMSFRNTVDELTQEYMLKMALSSTKIFPWFYDMARQTMVIDPRYFDYTGIVSPDCTMSLEQFADRIHPEDREAMFNAFDMQLHGSHYPYPVPFRLRRGDDRYEWFEGQSTYLGQVEGIPYRVVGICMSTQAHKDIEDSLRAARDKAEQSDRLKSAFLSNMSHEIRTPLNAIVGFSNLLAGAESDLNTGDAREYAALISKNCDHLLLLVSDILDLSRIETDTMEYNFAAYSLGQILTDLYEDQMTAVPEGVDFNLLLPPCDVMIETDIVRLRQVVGNLLGNAFKFTSRGHVDLGYTLDRESWTVRLFVEDTGRGIPADQYGKIFERFYKVDSFVQGAGLGLSICKILSERLGGRIDVCSQVAQGSRFTLALPLLRQGKHPISNILNHE